MFMTPFASSTRIAGNSTAGVDQLAWYAAREFGED
jgi:hypothetical protein